MNQASRKSGLELVPLNEELKTRSPARRLCFNLRVEETMGVLEFHCKVAEGSDPLKILKAGFH